MACAAPNANVHFLLGGTQANATVIDAVLRSYEGVLAAASGHISVHEAGAIEYGGHKVLALPHEHGKLSAATIEAVLSASRADENRDHMVFPGMVYLSQPTECGTLYTREELTRIHAVCRTHDIPLYLDGARLAYALACPENDVTLPDIARLCDIFYIGGTKCGALFGEAVVLPNPSFIPHFFTIIKQHGALLAKGRIAGIQFDTLFTDGLYEAGGATAIKAAARVWPCTKSGFRSLGRRRRTRSSSASRTRSARVSNRLSPWAFGSRQTMRTSSCASRRAGRRQRSRSAPLSRAFDPSLGSFPARHTRNAKSRHAKTVCIPFSRNAYGFLMPCSAYLPASFL
ncbi:threonine aldolase family protein [Mitsuokella sp. oral taxon 131]|uniref:threonine aldolase family protein n=1 Tax=Mitsuokella sp. oral taxon 131 TaxID=1321780 RepID=UPI0003AE3789|nr:Beta-eliminating lyase [Mitsuokella sp. oral taxon 131 str. W9106]